jgi:hypothetical protein
MLDGMGPLVAGTKIDLSGLDAGEEEFINKLNALILEAGMSADQVNAMLSGMGFTANFAKEPQEVQVKEPDKTITHHEISNRKKQMVNGGEVETYDETTWSETIPGEVKKGTVDAYSLETSEPGTTVVPKISSVTKKATGSANNYSSTNKGGGAPSKGSGSSSKPKKVDKIENETDRYHEVDTQIQKVENGLKKIERQQKKTFGADFLEALNDEYELLNEQIDNYNEKLEIAKEEQDELKTKLASQGVQFNADGTIANYEEIIKKEEDKVNALIERYNNLSVDEQKK